MLTGEHALFVTDVPSHLLPADRLNAQQSKPCHICNTSCTIRGMRNHVGGHVLRFMRSGAQGKVSNAVTSWKHKLTKS
jgi:hypothetical protein